MFEKLVANRVRKLCESEQLVKDTLIRGASIFWRQLSCRTTRYHNVSNVHHTCHA